MNTSTLRTSALPRVAALAAIAAFALSACSGMSDVTEAESTTMTDPWVKAVDDGMTAAFGVLTNDSDEDVTIVAASTDTAPTVELHETSMDATGGMSMSPIEGGFVIPAGGSLTLEVGSFHIMIMGVSEPIVAGDDVDITLTFSDDSTLDVTATAKEFTGANEHYDGGEDAMEMSPSPEATDATDATDMESDS